MASSKYSPKSETISVNNISIRVIDRVSHLSNNILHHILSFLDTGSVVQTSILSRRWRCLWKDIPVPVNFSRNSSFSNKSDFQKHVDKFISLRFESTVVRAISFDLRGEALCGHSAGTELFDGVMQYMAAARVVLAMCTATGIHNMAGAMAAHNVHGSLETLQLHKSNLLNSWLGYASGFKLLTTLELSQCLLYSSVSGKLIDPFSKYHHKLISCGTSRYLLKVSGFKMYPKILMPPP
ncbi:unnamed protein product [Linum tenue]|uniref:F-box domain-containing protein n=1 Tax=Linum tenue TaxID=586396 RepID=A0AAV0GVX7_9ROSI|nr:unnamed protein product [Linum tenue]